MTMYRCYECCGTGKADYDDRWSTCWRCKGRGIDPTFNPTTEEPKSNDNGNVRQKDIDRRK